MSGGILQQLTRMRPISDVAFVTGRPYRTIQAWVRQDRVPHTRRGDGRVLVDLVAAVALSEQTGRRTRKAAA